jgi:hypothetical protein
MSETKANRKKDVWPKSRAIYLETVAVVLLALFTLFLQYGRIDYTILLSYHAVLTILASLSVWFANMYALEKILQSRIESDKITQYLPFELLAASVTVTSIIYVIVYLIFSYLEEMSFVLAKFILGFSVSIGLSLLFVAIYVGSQVWKSWWSDGDFLFGVKDKIGAKNNSKDFITIKNSRGIVNLNLHEVCYFISESKIVFLVDTSGKKWITQYNLSELEKNLDDGFFRLNRRILVSRKIISHIKKLPNHRLLVTIGPSNEDLKETISRYKSTKFKQWFHNSQH